MADQNFSTVMQGDVELGGAEGFNGQGGGQQEPESKHKTARMFHLLFKSLAIFVYLFSSWFSDSFVIVFVTLVLLLAFDFWTVKNVTGRLLVGLRWWSEVKDDGTNDWIFETCPPTRKVHPKDELIFWTSLYGTPVVWAIFGIGCITGLDFQWLLVVSVALTLSFANVYGYWRCKKDAKKNVKNFIASSILSQM